MYIFLRVCCDLCVDECFRARLCSLFDSTFGRKDGVIPKSNRLPVLLFMCSLTGGSTCGPLGNSVCQYYIGVAGYCTAPGSTSVAFDLTATRQPTSSSIFKVPVLNKIVQAESRNSYSFCVDSVMNVTAQMKSFRSACQCPYSYSNLGVVISRYRPDAQPRDLTWKMLGSNHTGAISMSSALIVPGTYYMNVIGTCDDECTTARCTCAPCSNLPFSPYSLYVGGELDTAKWAKSYKMGSCAVPGVIQGPYGQCGYLCPHNLTRQEDFLSRIPPLGMQFGIAGGVLAFLFCSFVSCFFCNYQIYLRGRFSVSQESLYV